MGRCEVFVPNPFRQTHCKNCQLPEKDHVQTRSLSPQVLEGGAAPRALPAVPVRNSTLPSSGDGSYFQPSRRAPLPPTPTPQVSASPSFEEEILCSNCKALLPPQCNFCGQCGLKLDFAGSRLVSKRYTTAPSVSSPSPPPSILRSPTVPPKKPLPTPPKKNDVPQPQPQQPQQPQQSTEVEPQQSSTDEFVIVDLPTSDIPEPTENSDLEEEDLGVSMPEKSVVFEAPPPPFQPTNKREFLVVEILTTERTYVTNLTCMIETLLIPLRKQYESGSSERPLLSMENIETLFSNVEDIRGVNSTLLTEVFSFFFFCLYCSPLPFSNNSHLLLSQLENRISCCWSPQQTIGDAIRKLIPFLKMYRHYTANYEKAQVLLSDLMIRNQNFCVYVKKWEQTPKMDMIPLLSYLILPVQRIPRYNMLLRDLLKNTSETHPDYHQLSQVYSTPPPFFFLNRIRPNSHPIKTLTHLSFIILLFF